MTQSPEASVPAPGRAFGKYQLVQELGRGGMGIVFRAWDKTLKRTVALKMLVAGDTASPEEEERLYKEATANARLAHPNILPVYEVGRIDGRLYFTMEFIRGSGFDRLMLEKKLDRRRGMEILRDVCQALAFAHSKGILHRDVKPANIMVAQDGHVYLMDFGLARNFRETAKLTQTGFVMGTPNYMSPEQCRGERETLDGRSDVFGVACVMYEFFTGAPPFDSESMVDILLAVLKSEAIPPGKRVPDLPAELETICLKGMRKERDARYATAALMAEDIDRWMRGDAISALPETTWERWRGRVRRQKAMFGIAATAAVVVLAALGFGASAWSRSRAAEQGRSDLEQAQERRDRAKKHFDAARVSWDIAEKCLLSGRTADLAKHLGDAAKALDQALAVDAGYGEALALRGRVYNRLGQREQALADLSASLALEPGSAEARYERAKVRIAAIMDMGAGQRARGKPEQAPEFKKQFDEHCTQAEEDLASAAAAPGKPAEWMTAHCRGARAFLGGRLDESAATLGEAVQLNPFLDDALDLRGYVSLVQGKAADALRDFAEATRVNPMNVNALNHRGVALAEGGDPAQAAASYEAALAVNPGFLRARINLARALRELGRPQDAVAAAEEVVRVDAGNLLALEARAAALLDLGKAELAASDFTEVLRRFPESSLALAGRAVAHRMLGSHAMALADATRAAELDPKSLDALLERALAREATGDDPGAVADFGAALALEPGCAAAYANRGRLHGKAGRRDEAVADWENFLKHAPPGHPRVDEVRKALEEARGPR